MGGHWAGAVAPVGRSIFKGKAVKIKKKREENEVEEKKTRDDWNEKKKKK